MPESTFTFRVDETLKAAFTAAAKANDRSGAQVLRDVMRDYAAAEVPELGYKDWLVTKISQSIAQADAGMLIPGEEVEAHFAEKREEWRSAAKVEAAE